MCKRCVMDTTDVDIEFDEKGYCNYCNRYYNEYKKNIQWMIKKEKFIWRIWFPE